MKNTICIISLLMLFCSCEGFLTTDPKGTFHEGNYDMSSGQELLILSRLVDGYDCFRELTWPITAMHCHTTKDSHAGGPEGDGGVDFCQFPTLSFTPANSHFTTYYSVLFKAITKANEALAMIADKVEEMGEEGKTDPTMLRYEAEAYFIRSAAYYYLTEAFGAVPYVDRVMSNEEEIADQLPADEIRERYISDLTVAIPYLMTRKEMVGTGNIGRATQNAARAIVAKTYLHQKNWALCRQYSEAIIASDDNDLTTPYADIFLEVNEYGPESVWEINAEFKPDLDIDMMCQWTMMTGVRGFPNLGWGHNAPTQELMSAYEKGDPRYEATVLKDGDILNGETIVAASYKYFNKKSYIPPAERRLYGRDDWCYGYWTNQRFIRYAEILLMNAEAACEQGGEADIETALDMLEQVRTRARAGKEGVLPKITETDQAKLREIIRHERRIELALEYERYFDLVRWGIAKDELPDFETGKHELFPIPQSEIDKADGKLKQNPNYS